MASLEVRANCAGAPTIEEKPSHRRGSRISRREVSFGLTPYRASLVTDTLRHFSIGQGSRQAGFLREERQHRAYTHRDAVRDLLDMMPKTVPLHKNGLDYELYERRYGCKYLISPHYNVKPPVYSVFPFSRKGHTNEYRRIEALQELEDVDVRSSRRQRDDRDRVEGSGAQRELTDA
ncbi:hypothetical protein BKA93DRAFT_748046 [Sparassis latifolia]